MPIYEFSCAKCGNLSEVVQRVGARPPPCPVCGSKRMTRAVSRTAFHLKGGGWYADLYSTPRPGGEKGEGAEAEKPAATGQADGTAKPAAEATVPGKEAAPRERSRPARRRPVPPRKRH